MRFSLVRARLIVALVAIASAAVGACSLNPQPIPPGAQDTAAGPPSAYADASTNKAADGSSSTGDATEGGGTAPDADVDVNPPTPFTDAATDGTTAEGDASPDAGPDAEADASDAAPE